MWSLICVGPLLLSMRPLLHVFDRPSVILWKESSFLSHSCFVRDGILYPLTVLHAKICLDWICEGFLYAMQPVWVHVCTSPLLSGKCCFSEVISGFSHHFWIHTLFPTPLLNRSLSLQGRGLRKTCHLELRAPKCLILCTLSSWGSQSWIPCSARKSCSDKGWATHYSMETAVSLLLCYITE